MPCDFCARSVADDDLWWEECAECEGRGDQPGGAVCAECAGRGGFDICSECRDELEEELAEWDDDDDELDELAETWSEEEGGD